MKNNYLDFHRLTESELNTINDQLRSLFQSNLDCKFPLPKLYFNQVKDLVDQYPNAFNVPTHEMVEDYNYLTPKLDQVRTWGNGEVFHTNDIRDCELLHKLTNVETLLCRYTNSLDQSEL